MHIYYTRKQAINQQFIHTHMIHFVMESRENWIRVVVVENGKEHDIGFIRGAQGSILRAWRIFKLILDIESKHVLSLARGAKK